MLKKIFYILKPFIPRSLQLYLRRNLIRARMHWYKDVWPILKGSETPPEGWKGWPEGIDFALILTHDVEHQKGYDRVLQLMQVEKDLGFVSSFNFVPERDYQVEKSLLNNLKEDGFEYGVHGLKHDGKLFTSENEFLRRSERINYYLKEWDAVGFRAPAMHHNLDWIGKLNILYDLSTFDTDPFEPQPDGVRTIFPFGVRSDEHYNGGYIEMPYTLVQDFTLLILMRELTPKIWVEKLNWIAKKGGMVLLNVHPDYINFNNERKIEEFPVDIYKEFLLHVKNNYAGRYWNVLPKELAEYIKPGKDKIN